MKKSISILLAVAILATCLAVPAVAASNPYTDVKSTDWFYNDVMYCYENGIMLGMGNGKFAPKNNTTRAEMAQAMYRLLGGEPTSETAPFTDVKSSAWYATAVNWCYAHNIVNGDSKTTFSPNKNITREQVVTILYRSAVSLDADTSEGSYDSFADAAKVSNYAKTAWGWSVKHGIINGEQTGGKMYLYPQRNITRAELATVLARFVRWYEGQVTEEGLTGIYLILADDVKVSYFVGEELDLTGVTVMAKYSDGTEKEVTDYTHSVNMSTAGDKLVSITYKWCMASYEIHVQNREGERHLESISVKLDDNAVTRYPLGATEVDLTGVHVTAFYDDGTWEEVFDFTAEFDGATDRPGNILVIVKYQEAKTDYMARIILPESMRYNMEEARDVANAYALELGFEAVDVSMTPADNCACEEMMVSLYHGLVEMNGGQSYLNESAKQVIQDFQERVKLNAEENDEIPDDAWKHLTVNVYVSWDDPLQGYTITVLYKGE